MKLDCKYIVYIGFVRHFIGIIHMAISVLPINLFFARRQKQVNSPISIWWTSYHSWLPISWMPIQSLLLTNKKINGCCWCHILLFPYYIMYIPMFNRFWLWVLPCRLRFLRQVLVDGIRHNLLSLRFVLSYFDNRQIFVFHPFSLKSSCFCTSFSKSFRSFLKSSECFSKTIEMF